MTVTQLIMNYLVPVVSGVFFLLFLTIFGWVLHKLMKTIGGYRIIGDIMLRARKKKLLADQQIMEYCVARVEKDWDEPKVREELLLANKYSKKRINEIVYVFNIIKREIKGAPGKKRAQDLP